jgi:thioredoxin 1
MLVLCLAISGCGGGSEDGTDADAGGEAGQDSVAVTGGTGLPVLLDLGSTTCVPCKAMAPILDEMRETFAGQLEVRFVDVREDAEAARDHEVRIIPTQIFLDEDGNELFRHQGFFSREDMLAKWADLGYEFTEGGAQS